MVELGAAALGGGGREAAGSRGDGGPSYATASPLEVVLPSGARVMVPNDFDETTLGRLLTVLEGR